LCKKIELTQENIKTAVSLPVCRLYCNEDIGTVWPKPTGDVKLSNDVVKINLDDIVFKTDNFKMMPGYWSMAETRFREMQKKKLPKKFSIKSGGKRLVIEVVVKTDDMGKQFISTSPH
jgi:hexosaminidase